MTTVLITIPFFAVIACGFLATRIRIIDSAGRAGLNQFVYYFALPVLIFSLMAQADLRGEFHWMFIVAWLGVGILLFAVSLVIARTVFRLQRDFSAVFATACIYGNTGYFGLPFVIIAFGPEASVPVVICTTADLAVMLPLASFLLERSRTSNGAGTAQMFATSFKSIVKNPMIVAALLGALFSVSSLQMPDVADRFVVLLGSAAAPCALFALGSRMVEDRANFLNGELFVVSFIKLAIHPLLIWLAMFHLLAVDTDWASSAVIAASMPVAVTAFVLAQQYNTYVARTSASILLSTVISLATLSFILTQIT